MKLSAQDAVVTVTGARPHPPQPGQALTIFRSSDAVIGIDGHTAFQDQVVEVCWQGAHAGELIEAVQVEIRDGAGTILESLPIDPSRQSYEKDGNTYFYLKDA